MGLAGVLSLSCSLEEGARGTGTWNHVSRWHDTQFGPDDLARTVIVCDAPAVRESVHEQQPTSRLGVRAGPAEFGQALTARVRDLDTKKPAGHPERETEVPSRDAAMGDGVGRQLGDEMPCGPMDREEHAGADGGIEVLKFENGTAVGRSPGADYGRPVSEPRHLRILELRYGIIRAQALTPRESMAFIERLLGET